MNCDTPDSTPTTAARGASEDKTRAYEEKIAAGEAALQAQAEAKIGEMAGNDTLQQSAAADSADAEHRARTADS